MADFRSYTDYSVDRVICFLQELFDALKINEAPIEDFRLKYLDDEDDTDVRIMGAYTSNLKAVEKVPAIVVQRLQMRWQYTNIGQRADGGSLASSFAGNEKFQDLIQSPIQVNCIAKTGLKAEKMANICFMAFTRLRGEIQKRFGFFRFFPMELGAEQVIRTTSEYDIVNVPISVNTFFEESGYLATDGEKFGALMFTLWTTMNKSDGTKERQIIHVTDP